LFTRKGSKQPKIVIISLIQVFIRGSWQNLNAYATGARHLGIFIVVTKGVQKTDSEMGLLTDL
jgi:hypothetical protein